MLSNQLAPIRAESPQEPAEHPVWPAVAPGSEGITEAELVVERGDGETVVDRSISNVHRPTVTIHFAESAKPAPAVIICPGGGLTRVVIDKEGHALAKFLNAQGITGIVLKFRTAKSPESHYGVEPPVADLRRAIRLVRTNSKEWNIDSKRVGVFGFSAGGILAATIATHHDLGDADSDDPVERASCRPDFVGMAYPITTLDPNVVGRYTKLLLGENPTADAVHYFCNDEHVDGSTPPTFLCHAADDSAVKIENSQRFKAACDSANVPCTLFTAEKGGHGYGLRDEGNPINAWPRAFEKWLKQHGLANQP